MTSVYDSERLAAAYAFDRPPIHEKILRSARLDRQADRALDVGCGAGLSTAALAPLARRAVGLEPIPTMLAHHRTVAPQARFVIGQAERLPFAAGSFDLVTAAGSLNYTDLPSALAEIARVLTRDGTFLLYDFSVGRRSVNGDELAGWFASFEQRFPWPQGWQPFDVRELAPRRVWLAPGRLHRCRNPADDGLRRLPALHAQRGQRGQRHRARGLQRRRGSRLVPDDTGDRLRGRRSDRSHPRTHCHACPYGRPGLDRWSSTDAGQPGVTVRCVWRIATGRPNPGAHRLPPRPPAPARPALRPFSQVAESTRTPPARRKEPPWFLRAEPVSGGSGGSSPRGI